MDTSVTPAKPAASTATAAISAPPAVTAGTAVFVPVAQPVNRPTHQNRRLHEDAVQHHDIAVQGVTPEQAQDPSFLWVVSDKLPRWCLVTIHDDMYRWEYTARILKIDKELQLIYQSLIGAVTFHQTASAAKIDWSSVKIERKGAKAKWTISLGTSMLQDGFESEDEALGWVARKKLTA